MDSNDQPIGFLDMTEGTQTYVRALGVYDLGGGRGEWTNSITPQWSVDSSVAAISSDGLVRAVVNGTATVTAELEGVSATATVNVR